MKLLNPQIKLDLDQGRPIQLDLGCGQSAREGFYAVDIVELDGVDIVADLNRPLELLPDNCVQRIYTSHALEHIQDFLSLMREMHRLTMPGGSIEVVVPHFSNVYGYSDPTHVRFFGLYTMYYFVAPENQPGSRKLPHYYTDVQFRIVSIRIEFYRLGIIDRVLAPVLTYLVNKSHFRQDFYERRLSGLFHARQIRYLLQPVKQSE